MLAKLLSFVNSAAFKLLVLVVVLAGGTIMFLNAQLVGVRERLRLAQDIIQTQEDVIEAMDNQVQLEGRLRGIVEDAVSEIERSPNAGELVPHDIAAAWGTGIERLRNNEERSGTNESKRLRSAGASERRGLGSKSASGVLHSTGGSLPGMSQQGSSAS